jgi:hypothetical protein
MLSQVEMWIKNRPALWSNQPDSLVEGSAP